MLRIVVLLLVLANAGFYGWRQGWLDTAVGVRAQGDREPGRLAAQVAPATVRVLAPLPTETAANQAAVCLEIDHERSVLALDHPSYRAYQRR